MANRIWAMASDRLKRNEPALFDQWLKPLLPLGLDDEQELVLGAANDFVVDFINRHYSRALLNALTELDGNDYVYRLEPGHSPPDAAVSVAPSPEPKAKTGGAAAAWSTPLFDNFVVSEENRYAFLASRSAVEEPGLYNPLYLYGVSGIGKTHLLRAAETEARRRNLSVRYTTCEALLTEFYDLLTSHRSLTEFRASVRGVDMLLIDDVHMLAGKPQIQEEFFNLFNALHLQRKQIILTSDKEPCEIKGLEPRLVTRFESGVTTEISPPGVEARLAILRMISKDPDIKVKLEPRLLEFLAEHIASSVRRLKGAFLRLATLATMSGQSPTIAMAEELLQKQLVHEARTKIVGMDRIQQVVAEHFGISLGDILSSKRPRNIAEPRMVAMYLCRTHTEHSLPEIGKAFGKNHATILNAMKKIPELCSRDEALRRSLSQLERKLK